jgi:hypothetical protein
MYSPLNEDLMFQEMHDRTARITAARGKDNGAWPNRRWWRRTARLAR